MPYIPEIAPTFVEQTPVIDGKITEVCWSLAARTGNFYTVSSGSSASVATDVRLCYDSRNLYICFECQQPKLDEIVIKHTEDGDQVWRDESVEVFISPFAVPDRSTVHHFAINAAGAKTYLLAGRKLSGSDKWRAAASTGNGEWSAEFAIPFDMLKPLGRNEDCWRINFCRNSRLPNEQSSWAMIANKTNSIRKYGKLLQPQSSPRFIGFRSRLEIHPGDKSVSGTVDIPEIPDSPASRDLVIPQPRLMRYNTNSQSFTITEETRIVIGRHACETTVRAAKELNDELLELVGYDLQIVRDHEVGSSPVGSILIGQPNENAAVRHVVEQDKFKLSAGDPGVEGYILDVNSERIAAIGIDEMGTFWGVQTLKQLTKTAPNGIEVPAVFVKDWPRFSFRGVHLPTYKEALPFYEKLIERVLSRFKINRIVLQTDAVAWSSRPEVADQSQCMSKKDVSALIEIARNHCIEVIPLVQTFGHLEWAFRNGNNLDIAEDKEHPYSYCPSNPKSYEFIFNILDEAIELFRHPKYIHTGRDEFDLEGIFPVDPECQDLGKEECYIQDTIKIHDHLQQKGCGMIMWGDVLARKSYQDKIDRLPKDIIIADWRYTQESYPSLDYYKQHEFAVIASPWHDPLNIYGFSKEASKKDAIGMLQTTWNGFTSEQDALERHNDELYAYIVSAGWAWSPLWPPLDKMPYEPDIVFRNVWDRTKCKSGSSSWFSVVLGSHYNVSTHDSARTIGWLGLGKGNDLRKVPAGVNNMGGTPHVIPKGAIGKASAVLLQGPGMAEDFPQEVRGIEVDRAAHALHFLHTSAWPEDHGAEAGEYVIRYEDGTEERIPLVYGRNISSWTDRSPVENPQLAWRGQTADGSTVRLESYGWDNPYPDKVIKSIDFVSAGSQCAPVLLSVTGEVREDSI